MKKLFAITLLTIHLFNLAGYPLLFRFLIASSSKQLSVKIDRYEYADADLIEIKVPLNTPYIGSRAGYENYDGEVTIDGSHHHYVKRKIVSDTLYLLCLPNKKSDQLDIAKNDFNKKVNDFDGDKKEDIVKKANVINQYVVQKNDFRLYWCSPCFPDKNTFFLSKLLTGFTTPNGQPPDWIG